MASWKMSRHIVFYTEWIANCSLDVWHGFTEQISLIAVPYEEYKECVT
jgi:hypothetical protein